MKIEIIINDDKTGYYTDLVDNRIQIESPCRLNVGDSIFPECHEIIKDMTKGCLIINYCFFTTNEKGKIIQKCFGDIE